MFTPTTAILSLKTPSLGHMNSMTTAPIHARTEGHCHRAATSPRALDSAIRGHATRPSNCVGQNNIALVACDIALVACVEPMQIGI